MYFFQKLNFSTVRILFEHPNNIIFYFYLNYFSNNIFSIINTHLFGICNFKKHTVLSTLFFTNKLLITQQRNDCQLNVETMTNNKL